MEERIFQNGITDRELKEKIGDIAISTLVDLKLVSAPKDLKHLVIEFGYLLITENPDEPCAMLKVILPKRPLKPQKIYYLGIQEGTLHVLNEQFTEATFRQVQKDMFAMHHIDINDTSVNAYRMELY